MSKLVIRNVVNNVLPNNEDSVNWTNIAISDENGNPIQNLVKKINMTIEAGDPAVLVIEEYVTDSDGKTIMTNESSSTISTRIPVTKKTAYTIAGFKIITSKEIV